MAPPRNLTLKYFWNTSTKKLPWTPQPWTKDRLLPTLWGNLIVQATWVQSWCFLIRWASVWPPILHLQVQPPAHEWQVCLEAQLGLQVCYTGGRVTTSCRRCTRASVWRLKRSQGSEHTPGKRWPQPSAWGLRPLPWPPPLPRATSGASACSSKESLLPESSNQYKKSIFGFLTGAGNFLLEMPRLYHVY